MTEPLDIEQHDALLAYLRTAGHTQTGESPAFTTLTGGVSSRTVLVERRDGPDWVIKQSLARLRVAVEWYSDPERIHREALGIRWLAHLAPPSTVPALVFEDQEHHLLAMEAVPQPHATGRRCCSRASRHGPRRQFGHLLGTIHRRASERRTEIAGVFGDRSFFESLRIEPYYGYTATQVPEAARFMTQLIMTVRARGLTLVHGDFSPKNVLVHDGRLVLLDHEVIHFGDPAFDLGFALAHFLSKAHHLPITREEFAAAAETFWRAYRRESWRARVARRPEERAVRHTLGCLLAAWRALAAGVSRPAGTGTATGRSSSIMARAAALHQRPRAAVSSEDCEPHARRSARLTCSRDPRQPRPADGPGDVRAGQRRERSASVPSGASTGTAEALELRDGDPSRYRGLGCRKAAANVNGAIHQPWRAGNCAGQDALDAALLELDGTPNKSRLGANAILATSLAFARAVAAERAVPLYQHFADIVAGSRPTLPRLTINLFSGGKHAGGQVPIQDVLLVPPAPRRSTTAWRRPTPSTRRPRTGRRKYGLRRCARTRAGSRRRSRRRGDVRRRGRVDPARRACGPGEDVALAIDVASSHFYDERTLSPRRRARSTARGMIDRLVGLAQTATRSSASRTGWRRTTGTHWPALARAPDGGRALVLGDDFLCTNPGAHPPRDRRQAPPTRCC